MKKLSFILSVIFIVLAVVLGLGIVGNCDYAVETLTEDQTKPIHYLLLVLFITLGWIFKVIHDKVEDK